MRYYSIKISKPGSSEPIRPRAFASLNLPDTYTSFVNGRSLPGALNVELNIPLYNYATPRQGAFVRVWGVSNEELGQGNDLEGLDIIIKGGMQKGLPLAKPAQAGVLVMGTIFQAYGNMEGTARTLDMILLPPTGVGGLPLNFCFSWRKNTPMADMIRSVLQTAMPSYDLKMAISDKLVMSSDATGIYSKLNDFSAAIKKLSMQKQFAGIGTLSGGPYAGVEITIKDRTLLVYDGTADYGAATAASPKQIAFEDLIGQPTWIDGTSINFKCVMRADLSVGDYIRMPSKLTSPYVLTVPGAAIPGTPARTKNSFEGTFVVQYMQHFGNFRQADAASWVTSFNAVFAVPPAQSTEQANQAKIRAAFNQ